MALALRKKLDATGTQLVAETIYVCVMSYASHDDACARGTRLKGSDPRVMQRPQFYADASLDDSELHRLRVQLAGGAENLF